MTSCIVYARYSSDMSRDASIEDQVMLCNQYIADQKWAIAGTFEDRAISGASALRPEYQSLLALVREGNIDVVLAEALDRLSRDQEDIAGIYKRMTFMGIKIFTLSEGEINEMHIGLKGTMSAIFLKDLADKTRRGLRGRIEKGKSGGGKSYGYDVIRQWNEHGEPICGERKINKEQAAIVNRIFREYLSGISPKAIAKQLNEEKIPGPSGKGWGPTSIYGHRSRGTGILNNELYIGQLVWNRLRYIKNPDTGKRVSRLNDEKDWIRTEVPELRIVDQELWDKVKDKQGEIQKQHKEFWGKKRPPHLFSYLLKCGCCGGGFSKISKDRYGCSTARNKGTCDNMQSIRQDQLEGAILSALKNHLMDEELCKVFCEEYTRHMNELRSAHNAKRASYEKELAKLIKAESKMIDAICEGYANEALKEKMHSNEARQKELKALLEEKDEIKVLMHPGIANQYHKEITELIASLGTGERRQEASQLIRSLIDKIVLSPSDGGLVVDLHGDLAGILGISARGHYSKTEQKLLFDQIEEIAGNPGKSGDTEKQVKMVAGAGFEPATFRL